MSLKIDTTKLLRKKVNLQTKKKNNNLYAKIKYGRWCKIPQTIIVDEEFVAGVSYYIGDGRTKTDRGLSVVDMDNSIILFFMKWLEKYFKVKKSDIKFIHYTNYKEVCIHRAMLKKIFDQIKPIVKESCPKNERLAIGYLRGIMAAEGSVKYHPKSCSRSIHLKMKDKKEVEYIQQLINNLGIRSSFLYSKSDDEWMVSISGVYELQKLKEINLFKISKIKKQKLDSLMSSYIRRQTKKGEVAKYYTRKVIELSKTEVEITAPKLAKFIKRDRTRVISVLRTLQNEGFLEGKRISIRGTPFIFKVTKKGKRLIKDFSKRLKFLSV